MSKGVNPGYTHPTRTRFTWSGTMAHNVTIQRMAVDVDEPLTFSLLFGSM